LSELGCPKIGILTERGTPKIGIPTERGNPKIGSPAERGNPKIDIATERGTHKIGSPTEHGTPKIGILTEGGKPKIDIATERGTHKIGIPPELGYVKIGVPTELGAPKISIPAELGISKIGIPGELGILKGKKGWENKSNENISVFLSVSGQRLFEGSLILLRVYGMQNAEAIACLITLPIAFIPYYFVFVFTAGRHGTLPPVPLEAESLRQPRNLFCRVPEHTQPQVSRSIRIFAADPDLKKG